MDGVDYSGQASNAQTSEDWKHITDPKERRKAQNRIAQRNFREKQRRENEERAGIAANQAAAGSAYRLTEPEELRQKDAPSGLPWGSINMRDVIERGRAREKQQQSKTSGEPASGS